MAAERASNLEVRPEDFLAPRAPFTLADIEAAVPVWGVNCGPAALAAVLELTLDQVRPHMGDFEAKHYTNPTLMLAALRSLGAQHHEVKDNWPRRGLVRVQWEGPWTAAGVPIKARYGYTHWVGSRHGGTGIEVFDVNCMCVGGWVRLSEWQNQVVPWLLRENHPAANGRWHATHRLEVGDVSSAATAGA